MTYETAELTFEPDDYLVLYSDGVIEAGDRRGTMLGTEGLTDLLAAATPESAQDLANTLFGAIERVVLRRAPA
ncbi:MAG: SpoIIE family protein phosphatase [Armatimonadetes bacterium]|nr:SpoIIE family protein phosphatase [Armatimonadota bacterium]